MPEMYDDRHSRVARTYTSNLTRWRHRYRGPRESLKINTEIAQFRHDIWRIHKEVNKNEDNLDPRIETLVDGGTVDNLTALWSDDATPSLDVMTLPGLDELQRRVEAMRRRIYDLEN